MTHSSITKFGYFARFMMIGAFCLLIVTAASAQAKQNFTLHNQTGKIIREIYIGPTSAEDWGKDYLGDEKTLGTNKYLDIKFSPKAKSDFWDIMVVFDDDKKGTWYKFDLSEITDITISYKNGKPFATWKNGDN